jgi:hypothetical protein
VHRFRCRDGRNAFSHLEISTLTLRTMHKSEGKDFPTNFVRQATTYGMEVYKSEQLADI